MTLGKFVNDKLSWVELKKWEWAFVFCPYLSDMDITDDKIQLQWAFDNLSGIKRDT